jgi:hypothetical protein
MTAAERQAGYRAGMAIVSARRSDGRRHCGDGGHAIYAQLSRGKVQLEHAEFGKLMRQTEEERRTGPEWLQS